MLIEDNNMSYKEKLVELLNKMVNEDGLTGISGATFKDHDTGKMSYKANTTVEEYVSFMTEEYAEEMFHFQTAIKNDECLSVKFNDSYNRLKVVPVLNEKDEIYMGTIPDTESILKKLKDNESKTLSRYQSLQILKYVQNLERSCRFWHNKVN